jgi:hypothetical protein
MLPLVHHSACIKCPLFVRRTIMHIGCPLCRKRALQHAVSVFFGLTGLSLEHRVVPYCTMCTNSQDAVVLSGVCCGFCVWDVLSGCTCKEHVGTKRQSVRLSHELLLLRRLCWYVTTYTHMVGSHLVGSNRAIYSLQQQLPAVATPAAAYM